MAARCVRCGTQENITKDHVVPRLVLRIVLGRERYAQFCSDVRKINLQRMCGPCNNWKATRVIDYRSPEEHNELVEFLMLYDIYDEIEFEEPVWPAN